MQHSKKTKRQSLLLERVQKVRNGESSVHPLSLLQFYRWANKIILLHKLDSAGQKQKTMLFLPTSPALTCLGASFFPFQWMTYPAWALTSPSLLGDKNLPVPPSPKNGPILVLENPIQSDNQTPAQLNVKNF